MLTIFQARWRTAAFVLPVIICIGIVWLSPSFQSCVSQAQMQKTEEGAEERSLGLSIMRDYPACVGRFLNTNNSNITAFATLLIAIFTFTLWGVSSRQITTLRAIERAYIILSHVTPDAGNALAIDGDTAHVTISVINRGNTPADILGGRIKLERRMKGERPPRRPDYRGPGSFPLEITYFLVARTHFQMHRIEFPFPTQYANSLQSGDEILCLIAYLDYRDRFGQIHRAGYARRFDPRGAGNNLFFETAPGYNYDDDI